MISTRNTVDPTEKWLINCTLEEFAKLLKELGL